MKTKSRAAKNRTPVWFKKTAERLAIDSLDCRVGSDEVLERKILRALRKAYEMGQDSADW